MGSERPPEPYRRIGSGAGSSVWVSGDDECPLTSYAFKRGDAQSIQRAFGMNQYVQTLALRLASILSKESDPHPNAPGRDIPLFFSVPYCYRLLHDAKQDALWWHEARPLFPQDHFRCATIHMERIRPIHKKARLALIEEFCPIDISDEIIASQSNSDCLVRPYLGRRRWREAEDMYRTNACFSLHNFPLHRDQMGRLKFPGPQMAHYAMAMAQTLAMLHWLGGLDGTGVEFALGSPRSSNTVDSISTVYCPVLDLHAVWAFDFECCSHITMDEKGLDRAVSAFLGNDPYYPRPSSDMVLWKVFKDFYITYSRKILKYRKLLGDEVEEDLPDRFISKLDQRLRCAEEQRNNLDPRSPEVPEPETETSEQSEISETPGSLGTPVTPPTPMTPGSAAASGTSPSSGNTGDSSEENGILKYLKAPLSAAASGLKKTMRALVDHAAPGDAENQKPWGVIIIPNFRGTLGDRDNAESPELPVRLEDLLEWEKRNRDNRGD